MAKETVWLTFEEAKTLAESYTSPKVLSKSTLGDIIRLFGGAPSSKKLNYGMPAGKTVARQQVEDVLKDIKPGSVLSPHDGNGNAQAGRVLTNNSFIAINDKAYNG